MVCDETGPKLITLTKTVFHQFFDLSIDFENRTLSIFESRRTNQTPT
jgi:hypothetical protein